LLIGTFIGRVLRHDSRLGFVKLIGRIGRRQKSSLGETNGGKVMKIQRVLIALTVLNLVLLVFLMAQIRPVTAQNIAPVLRGRALEIVDDQGRVRAEIKVLPAQPNFKMPDGTVGYPETVQLRLLTSQNGPNVKLGTTED
jgi:hypothetical protein